MAGFSGRLRRPIEGRTAGTGPHPIAHFQFVDALRGLAALWVVLFHLTVSTALPAVTGGVAGFVWGTLFGRGALGVAVFFVLSGFVIAHSLRRGLHSLGAFATFLVRRVIRLTPPYWAAIGLAIAMNGLASVVNHKSFAPGGGALSPARIASHLVYLEGLLRYHYINDVFWTLTIEMQFYVVLALFLLAGGVATRIHPAAFEVLVWVAGAAAVAGSRFGGDHQVTFVPTFYSFFLGVVVYWAWTNRISQLIVPVFASSLIVLFAQRSDAFLAASVLTGLALAAAAWSGRGLSRWLSARPLQFLGRTSYSLYLVHVPVQGAALVAVTRALGTGPAAVVTAAVVSTAVSLVAAAAFWPIVERPAMRWSRARKEVAGATAPATNDTAQLVG